MTKKVNVPGKSCGVGELAETLVRRQRALIWPMPALRVHDLGFLNPATQFRTLISTMNKEFLFLYDDTPLPHPYTAEQRKLRIAALHCIDVLHATGMNHSEAIASVCTVLQQLRIA
ncbi:MAG: hypothetical protein WA672_18485 [Candidatus Angelobacter sp.]